MARPRTSKNKPYGRQAAGKTIKSVSLEDDIVAKGTKEAEKRGISFSELVNGLLKGTIKLSVIVALLWQFLPESRPTLRSAGKAVAALAAKM